MTHPAWQDLREKFSAKKIQVERTLVAERMAGDHRRTLDGAFRDAADFAYYQGFLAGAKFVLDTPGRLERELESELRKQTTKEGGNSA